MVQKIDSVSLDGYKICGEDIATCVVWKQLVLAFRQWQQTHHIFTLVLPPLAEAVVSVDSHHPPANGGQQPLQDAGAAVASLQLDRRRLPSGDAAAHPEADGRPPAASSSDTAASAQPLKIHQQPKDV